MRVQVLRLVDLRDLLKRLLVEVQILIDVTFDLYSHLAVKLVENLVRCPLEVAQPRLLIDCVLEDMLAALGQN